MNNNNFQIYFLSVENLSLNAVQDADSELNEMYFEFYKMNEKYKEKKRLLHEFSERSEVLDALHIKIDADALAAKIFDKRQALRLRA